MSANVPADLCLSLCRIRHVRPCTQHRRTRDNTAQTPAAQTGELESEHMTNRATRSYKSAA